jgi:hypothetical protein
LTVYGAVRDVLPLLNSCFTIREVRETLKDTDLSLAERVKRSSLATALGRMGRAHDGFRIVEEGKGKRATVFQKLELERREVISPAGAQASPEMRVS